MADTAWTVVVAGGDGRRFGRKKQFETLGDRLVVDWSIAAARAATDEVVLVVPVEHLEDVSLHGRCRFVVAGGPTRSASVRSGLAAVPNDVGIVAVHDAARPCASAALFCAVLEAVRAGADAAVPGIPVADTVKRVRNGVVLETLDRSDLVAVQTPQAFRATVLRAAHADEPEATDDAALVEAAGGVVAVVPGEVTNRKLTNEDDLDHIRNFVRLSASR